MVVAGLHTCSELAALTGAAHTVGICHAELQPPGGSAGSP